MGMEQLMDQVGSELVQIHFLLQVPDRQGAALPQDGGVAAKFRGTGDQLSAKAGQFLLEQGERPGGKAGPDGRKVYTFQPVGDSIIGCL